MLIGAALGARPHRPDSRPRPAPAHRRTNRSASRHLARSAGSRGEPVARILGAKEFWGLPLRLSAATLVPRPDTETVVELALELLRTDGSLDRRCASPISAPAPARFCWRCCPNCRTRTGVGTDISEAALQTAAANAAHSDSRIARRSSRAIMRAALSGPFDLIVSNPPYIRSAEIAGSRRRCANHDPAGRARRRRRRTGRLSRADSAGGSACWRPAPPWWWRPDRAKAAEIEALMAAAGLTPRRAAKPIWRASARAVAGHKTAR